VTRRKIRRLYIVEATWEAGWRRSRCYQSREAAEHRAQVWRTGKLADGSEMMHGDGPAASVTVTPSLPVVWEDEP
jgi:hypothetical protein